jgi:GTPase KRas
MFPNVKVLEAMMAAPGQGGLAVKTLKHKFKKFERCCSGASVLEWLVLRGFAVSRNDAVRLGDQLVEKRVLTPLLWDSREKKEFIERGVHAFCDDDSQNYQLLSSIAQRSSAPRQLGPGENSSFERFRIVLLGAEGAGKSSLIHRFHHKDFAGDNNEQNNHSNHHSEEHASTRFLVDGKETVIETLDTASLVGKRETTESVFRSWVDWGSAFLLCFSVVSRATFDAIPELFTRVVGVRDFKLTPFVLVGLKIDERPDSDEIEMEENNSGGEDGMGKKTKIASSSSRKNFVSPQEGAELAERYRCRYVEASAKSGEFVRLAFETVVEEARVVQITTSATANKSAFVKVRTSEKR